MENHDTIYYDILEKSPSSETVFLVLSLIKQTGKIERVIQECHKALKTYPMDIRIRKLLAESYSEAGLIPLAESELDKVIEMLEELVSSYYLQADILARQKRGKEARELLSIYLAHNPNEPAALDLMNSLRPQEDVSGEIPAPDQEGLPDIATATMAEIYFQQGKIDKAIETYEKVLVLNPDDIRSGERLDELKASIYPGPETEKPEVNRRKEKAEKIITILESWLSVLHQQYKEEILGI